MGKAITVITGGSEGLGKNIALVLARVGILPVLLARTETKLKEAMNEIKETGGEADYYVCDVTQIGQVQVVRDKILQKYDRVDILVSNAGVYFEEESDKMAPEKVRQMFEVNALGSISVIRAFLPQFKKLNRGQILAVVSIAGLESNKDWGLYTASKFAQTGFIDSLRLELAGTKIKVMGFYPEGIDTGIFKKAGLTTEPNQPWMMKPRDVAEVVGFMLTRPSDVNMSQVVVRKVEQ